MLPLLQTVAPAATKSSTMWYPTFLRFLISYDFYSKLGFLISYTVTSLLVLEILRLVYTDANKREVEKLIDSYTTAKTSPRPERKTRRIPLDELEKRPKTSRRKSVSPAMSPDSERTLVGEEERRRRKRAQSLVTLIQPLPQTQTQTQPSTQASPPPTRRLRKRSDTVTSNSSSSESRKLERRRREASPASLASSKASSRGGSPKPRKIKERDALQMSAMMSKVLRQKV